MMGTFFIFIKSFLITFGVLSACLVGFWVFLIGLSAVSITGIQKVKERIEEKHDQSRKD